MKKIARFRRSAGLTQFELSKSAGVARSKIANVETGRAVLTDAERQRILKVLVISIERNLKDLNAELDADG